jgi:leucyl/phenylalanyl-tRNA--protein transferase
MPGIRQLSLAEAGFPPTSEALEEPNGLLAVGGDLSPERLLAAYAAGIFPWYEAPQPILWWTPDPRAVLTPGQMHISRSLRRTLRRNDFTITCDRNFGGVIAACAALRDDGLGTWIGSDMQRAYEALHRRGHAHSVEVWQGRRLVGGLYGVSIGGAFFGESMFSRVSDASKVALAALDRRLSGAGFDIIDCQVETEHLNRLGARCISRLDFESLLAQTVEKQPDSDTWRFEFSSGELA